MELAIKTKEIEWWFDGIPHTGANIIFCFHIVWAMASGPISTLYRIIDGYDNGHIYRSLFYCTRAKGNAVE